MDGGRASLPFKGAGPACAREWKALAAVREVQEAWGLEDETDPAAWMAQNVYGVRFDYQTDCPGYAGPLYLLQGAGAPETAPTALVGDPRNLRVVEHD